MTDEDLKANEEKLNEATGDSGQANAQVPQVPGTQAEQAPVDRSAVARFNEEPFIVAVKALLLKIDLEPKIGWEVEWQAVRRELKALEESMK
jgi:hypothetical protein